ncbi:4'-phosphopantetheinyl transferase superfamily protein, partial [Thermus scotoductus]|uniref:4'-phosphopantetheinyl transferase superfamily protein n=1 Tax=Thermus scotoductus TaxID=37636 RepID=UPI0020A4CEF2
MDRVRRLLGRHGAKALKRPFTDDELTISIRHQDPAPSLATRMAAKEAIQKCWPESLSWKEGWVGMEGRKPVVRFTPKVSARLVAENLIAQLSLGHEKSHALAVVILEARA